MSTSNMWRNKRGKRPKRKQLHRMFSIISNSQTLLVTPKICRMFSLLKKKKRLILVAETCRWSSPLETKVDSSPTSRGS